jgi:hypothetical protein
VFDYKYLIERLVVETFGDERRKSPRLDQIENASMARCRSEIATIEAEILAGNSDLQGLCLALADWAGELRILQNEQRRRNLSPGGQKNRKEKD